MSALVLLAAVATSTASPGPVAMTLAEGSSVRFTAHQTFSSTEGKFTDFDGRFAIDVDDPSRSSITVRIKVASIDTDNSSRDEHLRNPDFFDVAKHPTMVFTSSDVRSKSKGWVSVKGKLQVKGRAVPVAFDMKLDEVDGGVRARGRMTLSRKKLGLDYEAPFYIPSIKDNVNVDLDVRLRR